MRQRKEKKRKEKKRKEKKRKEKKRKHRSAIQGKVVEVVQKFAYVKETSYGVTFDVVAEPDPEHLAYTGTYLHHHTDLNYRDKSPGMQLLHCLKVMPFSTISMNLFVFTIAGVF